MMFYLDGHNNPCISYAVDCFMRYMFGPRNYHYLTLDKFGWYFMENSSFSLCKLYYFSDDNFVGMYGHENPTDKSCVKTRNFML